MYFSLMYRFRWYC